jgi:hypothetical protein
MIGPGFGGRFMRHALPFFLLLTGLGWPGAALASDESELRAACRAEKVALAGAQVQADPTNAMLTQAQLIGPMDDGIIPILLATTDVRFAAAMIASLKDEPGDLGMTAMQRCMWRARLAQLGGLPAPAPAPKPQPKQQPKPGPEFRGPLELRGIPSSKLPPVSDGKDYYWVGFKVNVTTPKCPYDTCPRLPYFRILTTVPKDPQGSRDTPFTPITSYPNEVIPLTRLRANQSFRVRLESEGPINGYTCHLDPDGGLNAAPSPIEISKNPAAAQFRFMANCDLDQTWATLAREQDAQNRKDREEELRKYPNGKPMQ